MGSNLYQKVQLLGTKATSKISLLKRTISEKNGSIIDPQSMSTIPEEIKSIKTLANATDDIFDVITSHTLTSDEVAGHSNNVLNQKTGIMLLLPDFSDLLMGNSMSCYTRINTNLDPRDSEYQKVLPCPNVAELTSIDTSVKYVTHAYTFNEYIILLYGLPTNAGDYISKSEMYFALYTIDGIEWKSDIDSIISGFEAFTNRNVNSTRSPFTVLATFPWGWYIEKEGVQYVMDALNNSIYISPYQNHIDMQFGSISAVLDTITLILPIRVLVGISDSGDDPVYYRLDSSDTVVGHTIYFCHNDDPWNIREYSLENSDISGLGSIISACVTDKNTVAFIGIMNDSNMNYMVGEIAINTIENGNINITLLYHNIIGSSVDMIIGINSTIYSLSGLIFVNHFMSYTSYMRDMNDSRMLTFDGYDILISYSDGKYLHITYEYNSSYIHLVCAINTLSASDVPKNKAFLKNTGELALGAAGSNFNTLPKCGKVCNMELEDHILFSNKSIYDPRDQRFSYSQIIYYENYFYFIFGFKKHFMLLRSKDGYKWNKVYETLNSGIVYTISNFNKWRLEIIDGYLYLIQCGSILSDYGPVRINFADDGSISLVRTPELIWNTSDRLADNRMQYLYHACNGNVYGYYNNDNTGYAKVYMVNSHGHEVLHDAVDDVKSVIEVANKDDAILVLSSTGFLLLSDEEYYENASFDCLNIDMNTVKVFLYKDTMVMLQKSYNSSVPFIKFFTLKEDTRTAVSIPYNDFLTEDIFSTALPYEMQLYDRRNYLPTAVIQDNLLYVRDADSVEPGFVIDLSDRNRFVRFEDDTTGNNHKFMQYCNGIMFVIDSYEKIQSSYSYSLDKNYNWIDSAGSTAGFFALSADDNYLYYSEDGLNYLPISEYGDIHYDHIVAGGDFVIIYTLEGLTEKAYLSRDKGLTWENLVYPSSIYLQNAEMEKSSNGYEFVIFAKINETDPFNAIFKTFDYATWEEISVNTYSSPINRHVWRDITCSNDGIWAAIEYDSTSVVTSSDGELWNSVLMPRYALWNAVTYTKDMFIAVASGITEKDAALPEYNTDIAAYSYDGITWEELRLPVSDKWCGCAYGEVKGNSTVVVIANNSGTILVGDSPLRLELHENALPPYDWVRIIYQDNKFVAIARNNRYAYYSFDGVNWNAATLPLSADWRFLLYASGVFILIDITCTNMASSINGIHWLSETIETDRTYRLIDYHNDKFVVFTFMKEGTDLEPDETGYFLEYVGSSDTLKEWITCVFEHTSQTFGSKDGVVITRPNPEDPWYDTALPIKDEEAGYDWMTRSLPISQNYDLILEHKNIKLAFGKSEYYLYSNDYGKTWTYYHLTGLKDFNPEDENDKRFIGTFGLNAFIIVEPGSSIALYSYDGINWNYAPIGEFRMWHDIIYVNQKLYLFGYDTTHDVFMSNNIHAWKFLSTIPNAITRAIHTGRFIVWDDDTNSDSSYMVSTDGITWNSASELVMETACRFFDIDNILYAVYKDATQKIISRSTDFGNTWETYNLPVGSESWELMKINDKFFLIPNDSNIGCVSDDGMIWVRFALPHTANWKIGWGVNDGESTPSYNLMIPDSNEALYSYDGKYWYRSSKMNRMIYGNGFFVAIDTSEVNEEETNIFYSRNGVNWELAKLTMDSKLIDIVFGDGKFIAITAHNGDYVYQSLDLMNWEKRYLNMEAEKLFISYSLPGFSILTPGKDVHFIDKDTQMIDTQLSSFMNQKIGSCGTVTLMLDHLTSKGYIAKDADMNWSELPFDLGSIGQWTIRSLSTAIIIHSPEKVYIYSLYRDKWYEFNCSFTKIYSVEECLIYTGTKNEQMVAVLADKKIYFIRGLHNSQDEVVFDTVNGFELSLFTDTERDSYSMCSFYNHKSILITSSLYVIEASDFDFEMFTCTQSALNINIRDSVIGIAETNRRFISITNSRYYYLSYDGIRWTELKFVRDIIPDKIFATNHYFVGLAHDGDVRYLFYTKDGINITYQNFDEIYGIDTDIAVMYDTMFIEKYDEFLTEVLFYNEHIVLSASGTIDKKTDKVNPKKPGFAKGNFTINTNDPLFIPLDFTPVMVVIKSVPKSLTDTYEEIVISEACELYQGINQELDSAENEIILSKANSNVFVDGNNGSKIVSNGFVIVGTLNREYMYYAF